MATRSSSSSIDNVSPTDYTTPPSSSSLYPTPRTPGQQGLAASLPLSARSTSASTEQTAVNVNMDDKNKDEVNNGTAGSWTPSGGASTTVISQCGDDIDNDNDNDAPPEAQQRSSSSTRAPHATSPDDGELARSRAIPGIGSRLGSTLTEDQRKLAMMYREAAEKRSFVPILYFLAASLGKLILGLGVSLAIKGHYSHSKSGFAVGVVLAALGLTAVVAAALGFGAAASRINKRMGIIFKCFSIGGGIFISIGYALKQYFVSDHKPMFSIRLSFIPLALGTAMMGISLPNFTAYTELYRGRIVGLPIRHRPLAALLCLSPSMGILFGGWISAEVADWPVAFNSAVLTFAVALGYGGVALFWSNNLRVRAQMYEVILCKEEDSLHRQQQHHRQQESEQGQHHPSSGLSLHNRHQDEKA